MGQYLDVARTVVQNAQAQSVTGTGYDKNDINDKRSGLPEPPSAIVLCFICGRPIDRTKAGWGALDGASLHMGCYRRQYPNGHRLRRVAGLFRPDLAKGAGKSRRLE